MGLTANAAKQTVNSTKYGEDRNRKNQDGLSFSCWPIIAIIRIIGKPTGTAEKIWTQDEEVLAHDVLPLLGLMVGLPWLLH